MNKVIVRFMSELGKQFALRLHEVCDEKGIAEFGKGRERELAHKFKKSLTAVHKWLSGDAFPKFETMIQICKWAEVQIEWLASGRGEKYLRIKSPTDERKNFVIKAMEQSPDYVVDQIKAVVQAITSPPRPRNGRDP